MAGGIIQNGSADVVRAEDNFNRLCPASNAPRNTLEIGYKFCGIPLARKCEHAKQVVRAEEDGHNSRILLAAETRIEPPAVHRHCFHGMNRDDLCGRVI